MVTRAVGAIVGVAGLGGGAGQGGGIYLDAVGDAGGQTGEAVTAVGSANDCFFEAHGPFAAAVVAHVVAAGEHYPGPGQGIIDTRLVALPVAPAVGVHVVKEPPRKAAGGGDGDTGRVLVGIRGAAAAEAGGGHTGQGATGHGGGHRRFGEEVNIQRGRLPAAEGAHVLEIERVRGYAIRGNVGVGEREAAGIVGVNQRHFGQPGGGIEGNDRLAAGGRAVGGHAETDSIDVGHGGVGRSFVVVALEDVVVDPVSGEAVPVPVLQMRDVNGQHTGVGNTLIGL